MERRNDSSPQRHRKRNEGNPDNDHEQCHCPRVPVCAASEGPAEQEQHEDSHKARALQGPENIPYEDKGNDDRKCGEEYQQKNASRSNVIPVV
jgi:hypothetical protein